MKNLSLEILTNAYVNEITIYSPIQIWMADDEMEAARAAFFSALDTANTHLSNRVIATTHGPDTAMNDLEFLRYAATTNERELQHKLLSGPDSTNYLRHKILRHSGEAYPVDKAMRMTTSLRRYAAQLMKLYKVIQIESQNDNDYWWQCDITTCDDLDRAARFVWDSSEITVD